MPIGDPELRYATFTQEVDGLETDFEVSFIGGYINPAHVKAFSVLVDPETGLATDRQVHATEIISSDSNSSTVRVAPAIENGRTLVIYRDTAKTAMLVNYTDGTVFTKANLDLANRQLLMLVQEILDGVNTNSLTIEDAVSTVIDLNILVTQIYADVLELLAAGGIVSVEPRVWSGIGDGTSAEFTVAGADVGGAGFYDTYVDGLGLRPGEEYTVNVLDPVSTSKLVFTTPPAEDAVWFTVLRGYAKPYTGPTPLTSLRIPVITVAGTSYFAGLESEFALLDCTNSSAVTVNVKEIPSGGDASSKMGTGSYFSVTQSGIGQVTLAPENGEVILDIPDGLQAKTRAAGSTITATCKYGDGNTWLISGDLALAE